MSRTRISHAAGVYQVDRFEQLQFLKDLVYQEQQIFWQRFYAFATLHAGAFVLMTSSALKGRRYLLAIVGLLLGALWLYVQWASLHYADRWKDPYYKLLDRSPFRYSTCGLYARLFGGRRRASSTDVALVTVGLVCVGWILVLLMLANNEPGS